MSEQVVAWLFDYACCHREYGVIKAICSRYKNVVNISAHLNTPVIRYTTAIIHHILSKAVFEQFSLISSLIDEIYNTLSDVIPFQDYAALSFGVKMQQLFHYLKNNKTVTAWAKLNEYFPRSGLKNTKATSKELKRVNKTISNFRKFFLPLLAHSNQRQFYFKEEYPEEFGEFFMDCLTRRMFTFINQVEDRLPKPAIQKILDLNANDLKSLPSLDVAYDILLEYCVHKTSLSDDDMMDILTSIIPLHTQDRVYVQNTTNINSSRVYVQNTTNINSSSMSSDYSECKTASDITNFECFNTDSHSQSFTQLKLSEDRCDTNETDTLNNNDTPEELPKVLPTLKYRFKRKASKRLKTSESKRIKLLEENQHKNFSDSDESRQQRETYIPTDDLPASPEMIEWEVIAEGLLTPEVIPPDTYENTMESTGDGSVTNIDDITILSDEDSQVIQSSFYPEVTDSEDPLKELSHCIFKHRKLPSLKLSVVKLIRHLELDRHEENGKVIRIYS